MNTDQLIRLKLWFDIYSQSFKTGDIIVDHPVSLKMEHTKRVRENICTIGRSIELPEEQMRLAESIGLLHDICLLYTSDAADDFAVVLISVVGG